MIKKGISSNCLKIIAIIVMIIDHIGAYLYPIIDENTYYILRSIGRIAMPIFSYLLVQGYMHTKNVYRYIFRIFVLATFTQLLLLILGYINNVYYPNYSRSVNEYLCVLFSYVLSLILLIVIDKKIIINKCNKILNLFLRISIGLIIIFIYSSLKIEFDLFIPFVVVGIYGIERIFKKDGKLLLQCSNDKIINDKKVLYCLLLLFILFICAYFTQFEFCQKYFILFAPLLILLYNGSKGKSNKYIKYIFYCIYPIQHVGLYILGMLISNC